MIWVLVEYVLDVVNIVDQYDLQVIKDWLVMMILQNVCIWYISFQELYNKMVYFVDVLYQVDKISEQMFVDWQYKLQVIQLWLLVFNFYILDDFIFIKSDKVWLYLQLILDELMLWVVYVLSQYFVSELKVDIFLVLCNFQVMDSVCWQVMFVFNDYFVGIVFDQFSNQVVVGGILFFIGVNNGLMVNVNGYIQYFLVLFSDLLQGYFSYMLIEEQLEQVKFWYVQMMDFVEKGKVYDQVIMLIQMVLQVLYFQCEVCWVLLFFIIFKEVFNYCVNLKIRGCFELMVIGNMIVDVVMMLVCQIQQQLGVDGNEWCCNKDVVVNWQQLVIFNKVGNSIDFVLVVVFVLFNVDEFSSIVVSILLGQIIQLWFYNQLCIEEQFGYVVFVFLMNVGCQWGMGFLLQSSDKQLVFFWQWFQVFFFIVEVKLWVMKLEEFVQFQQVVISQMLQVLQMLGDEVLKLSKDFDCGNMCFDLCDKVVVQIKLLML